MKRILLIEDEPGLVLTLRDRLRKEGFEVEDAGDGERGLQMAATGEHDLIILDLTLPLKGGLDVCRDLRQQGVPTPVMMLTARGQVIDKVLGLKLGADDYLAKPFDMLELLARVEAILRRPVGSHAAAGSNAVYSIGNLRVDLRSTTVSRAGEPIALSAREFELLCYLIEHRGETLSRQQLLRDVWGYEAIPNTRTVDVHVAWLRQKVEDDSKRPRLILTVPGFGYRFAG